MESEIIREGRRVGNTTRQIDYYVQELMNAFYKNLGSIEITDHSDSKQGHIEMVKTLKKRLYIEHQSFRLIHDKERGINWYFLILTS